MVRRLTCNRIVRPLVASMTFSAAAELAAQTTSADVVEAYTNGFDVCLDVLRTQDIGDFTLMSEIDPSNRVRVLGRFAVQPLGADGVTASLYDDWAPNPDPPNIISCHISLLGQQELDVRVQLGNWVERMNSALAQFEGVVEFPPLAQSTIVRYGWCENDEQPFLVALGTQTAGETARVTITSHVADGDPNPCLEG